VVITKELMADIDKLLTPEQWSVLLYGDSSVDVPIGIIEVANNPVTVSFQADPFPGICDRCHGEHHDIGDELEKYDGTRVANGEYCRHCLSEFRMEE
jgi:hypothetical protein